MSPSSFDPQTTAQIDTFRGIVNEINHIPGVHISLSGETDRQRDALAFAVNETFSQFVESDWQLALKGLEGKIKECRSIKNPKAATTEIVKLIQHLFETRIHKLRADAEGNNHFEAIYQLYDQTIKEVIKNTPDQKPVSLAGIPQDLLPRWYLTRSYLDPDCYL